MPVTLRNNAACGIIIPAVDGDNLLGGLVAPGENITIGSQSANTSFVRGLVERGELILLGSEEDEEEEEDENA